MEYPTMIRYQFAIRTSTGKPRAPFRALLVEVRTIWSRCSSLHRQTMFVLRFPQVYALTRIGFGRGDAVAVAHAFPDSGEGWINPMSGSTGRSACATKIL